MKIYKTKGFENCFKKIKIKDEVLIKAANEMRAGQFDANLGGNLYKKRIGIGSKGKQGGARTLLAYKKNKHVFFLYGFQKNERSNINIKEKEALRKLAAIYLELTNEQLKHAIKHQELIGVCDEEKK